MPSLISNEAEVRAALQEFFAATAKVSALMATEYYAKAWTVQTCYDDSNCTTWGDAEPYTESKTVSIHDLAEGTVKSDGAALWLESSTDLAQAEVLPTDIRWMQSVGRAHELLGYVEAYVTEMSQAFDGKPIETPKRAPEPDPIRQLILNYVGVSRDGKVAALRTL